MGDEPEDDVPPGAPPRDGVTDSAARVIAADEAQPRGELPDPRDDYPNPALGFLTLFWTPLPPRSRSTPEEPGWSHGVLLVFAGGLVALAVFWALTQLL